MRIVGQIVGLAIVVGSIGCNSPTAPSTPGAVSAVSTSRGLIITNHTYGRVGYHVAAPTVRVGLCQTSEPDCLTLPRGETVVVPVPDLRELGITSERVAVVYWWEAIRDGAGVERIENHRLFVPLSPRTR